MEIESYLADLEEREKQWLEKDEIVKPEEPKPPKSQLPAPPVNSQLTSTENNEIQREIPKLPNGKSLMNTVLFTIQLTNHCLICSIEIRAKEQSIQ